MVNLTPMKSIVVSPPSIKESSIHLEYKLDKIIDVDSSLHRLIIGAVKTIIVKDFLYKDGRVDMDNLRTLERMGNKYYVRSDLLFELDWLD